MSLIGRRQACSSLSRPCAGVPLSSGGQVGQIVPGQVPLKTGLRADRALLPWTFSPDCGHSPLGYEAVMSWKAAVIVVPLLWSVEVGHAQSRLSESSFNSFVTDGDKRLRRISLVGEPTPRELDLLLPASATKMFRIVLTCAIRKSGKLQQCRRDGSFPEQVGGVAIARRAIRGAHISQSDMEQINGRGLRLQTVVYLDDPSRSLDRSNPWVVIDYSPPAPLPAARSSANGR